MRPLCSSSSADVDPITRNIDRWDAGLRTAVVDSKLPNAENRVHRKCNTAPNRHVRLRPVLHSLRQDEPYADQQRGYPKERSRKNCPSPQAKQTPTDE